jgi:tripartite-type tricarboxylate transporter receptor subunit TctC
LNTEINAAMKQPAVMTRLQNVGAELRPGSPGDLGAFLETDIDRWAKVIKQAGVKLD